MPQENVKRNGRDQRLHIELPRRDVHALALLRRRLYDITQELRFATPAEVEFWLYIVDCLFWRVEDARKTRGFTWNNAADAAEEVGLGPY